MPVDGYEATRRIGAVSSFATKGDEENARAARPLRHEAL
jgi:hypothetical protein